jgi:osmotically-inducible protein OsmY
MQGASVMTTSYAIPMRATMALRQSPFPALRKLSVEESEGSVILRGSVSSYYLKQLAQETVMSVLGSRELCNQVKVLR